MRVKLRDSIAFFVFGVGLLAAIVCYFTPSPGSGVHFAESDGRLVIGSVDYGSIAAAQGLWSGMIVTEISTSEGEMPLATLLPDGSAPSAAFDYVEGSFNGFLYLNVISRAALDDELIRLSDTTGSAYYSDSFTGPYWLTPYNRNSDFIPIVGGVGLFLAGWWWLRGGRGGEGLKPFAATLPLAMAMPLLAVAIVRQQWFGATIVASLIVAVAAAVLGLQFASRIEWAWGRRGVRMLTLALGVAAAWVGLLVWNDTPNGTGGNVSALWVLGVASITAVPGLISAWLARGLLVGGPVGSASDLASELGPVLMPAFFTIPLFDTAGYQLLPILVLAMGLAARRIGMGSVQRLVTRATNQRDLVVSATERERARIAGDIHDYALQDLTMLVRRLDAAGDVENAVAAREVADRLRAICGDLRLPILDDLGVGPALDWLVDRLEPDSDKLDLELFDREQRLAPDAELAFFRVAQEAIANATHHGAPPIMVRYWGGGDWAELIVDDAGPGIPAGAAEAAERSGHMGLMSMTQRAETIGAELTFGRRPGGGTRVHMVWERKGGAQPEQAADGGPAATEPSVEPA